MKTNNLNLSFGKADPKSLQPNSWNTNVVGPQNEEKLAASIERLGMFKPIIVRERLDGSLEILGGEHRAQYAASKGIKEVPILNVGRVDDNKAKEISLVDNGRYGTDDTLQLAELLDSLGSHDEIASFMPYSDEELHAIFDSSIIDLSELDIDEGDDLPAPEPTERPIQTHQVMRFKVPVEDAHKVSDLIDKIQQEQGFNSSDSLTNAGDALVWLCHNQKED